MVAFNHNSGIWEAVAEGSFQGYPQNHIEFKDKQGIWKPVSKNNKGKKANIIKKKNVKLRTCNSNRQQELYYLQVDIVQR